MKIAPLGPRVVIKPRRIEEKAGIVIPDMVKDKAPARGTVIAVGPGDWVQTAPHFNGDKARFEQFVRSPMGDVKIGDEVLFDKHAGSPYKEDGADLLVLHVRDILGKLEAES